MIPQPMIMVKDVPASSRWYQAVLGATSGHGGDHYERLVEDGRLLLQLHKADAHDHPGVRAADAARPGSGILLWFQTDHFDAAVARIGAAGATIKEGPKVNKNAHHREVWLEDPDGYSVVIAGKMGDLG